MGLKHKMYCFLKKRADKKPFKYKTPEEMSQALMKYDVISFDVFDTLIRRKVKEPKDVFSEVGVKLNIPNFRDIRVSAEKEARERHFEKHGDYECNLNEIYECVKDHIENDIETVKNTELETEYETCYADPFMLKFFNILRKKEKQICIVSDMYLPSEVIGKLLTQNGFDGYSELLISCEHGCGKYDGGLYKKLLKLLPKSANVVHIGDNYGSDVMRARAAGIATIYYR